MHPEPIHFGPYGHGNRNVKFSALFTDSCMSIYTIESNRKGARDIEILVPCVFFPFVSTIFFFLLCVLFLFIFRCCCFFSSSLLFVFEAQQKRFLFLKSSLAKQLKEMCGCHTKIRGFTNLTFVCRLDYVDCKSLSNVSISVEKSISKCF